MALISQADQARIAAAVATVEENTSGEIVCVVAGSASDYRSVPLVWAALLALALPWPLISVLHLSAGTVYRAQLALFIVAALVLSLANWRFAIVPGFVKRRRAAQAAREQFFAQGLHRTRSRTGILIYIAEAEHHAEIIADDGIVTRTDKVFWRRQVEVLVAALKQKRPADGLIAVIAACGEELARVAPPEPGDTDELPNRVVVL
jgi:putative membrane protein